MNSSLISLTTYDREISHPQLKNKFGRSGIRSWVSWIRSPTCWPLDHGCLMEEMLSFNILNQWYKMYLCYKNRLRSRFCSFSVHFFVFWVCSDLQGHHGSFCEHPRSSWHPLKPKIHAKIARNRQKTAAFLFMVHIGILRRMLQPLKAMMSLEVKASKSKTSYKNCFKTRSEIQCTAIHIALHCFPHKETRLHKPSLSCQAIMNLLDFCVLRLPWPPRTYTGSPLLFWIKSVAKFDIKVKLTTWIGH